ncbi:MAG: DoxX family membrane protein [Deltaproteobacteria bacterium]|nr:DoxX family membrane protein [Deltaproteobacteria bacterium]
MKTTASDRWMEWTWRLLRLGLGSVFIYAAIDKIRHPDMFSQVVYNYKLLPDIAVNLFALVLPWVEAVVGLFLILGLYEWISLTLFNGLLIIFMGALGLSLIRGLDISCGCFSSDPTGEKVSWFTLFRDSLVLIPGLSAYLLLVRLRRPPFFKRG